MVLLISGHGSAALWARKRSDPTGFLNHINGQRAAAHRHDRLPRWLAALVILVISALCWAVLIGIFRLLL
jgi:hypothetical protein